jgi:hypothetical protein
VLFAQHTRRFGNLCKLRILLGCSLQLPQLAPIMSVTLLCVLVGCTTPEPLKGNLYTTSVTSPMLSCAAELRELRHEGTLTVLELPNTLTGHSQGCLILATMHGHDMAATIPWRRPWHPLPGVAF